MTRDEKVSRLTRRLTPDAAKRQAAPALARAAAAANAFLLLVCSVLIVKFSFDSKIQFQQLSSVSTVKFSFDS